MLSLLLNCSAQAFERHFVFDSVPLTLDEIAESADRIFTGYCLKVEEIEKDPISNLPVIKYTFKIIERIKGLENINNSIVTFKQWKATATDSNYEIGKKYVLFLYPNSKLGLTNPVGILQGQFNIENNGNNEDYVINKVSNTGLTRNLKSQKRLLIKNDKNLNDYLNNCSEEGKPIKYKDFIKAVKYLINQ